MWLWIVIIVVGWIEAGVLAIRSMEKRLGPTQEKQFDYTICIVLAPAIWLLKAYFAIGNFIKGAIKS